MFTFLSDPTEDGPYSLGCQSLKVAYTVADFADIPV